MLKKNRGMKGGTEENECSFVCGMVIELSGGRGRESSPLQPPDLSYNMRRPYDEYAETGRSDALKRVRKLLEC